jgi:hypothetical protein
MTESYERLPPPPLADREDLRRWLIAICPSKQFGCLGATSIHTRTDMGIGDIVIFEVSMGLVASPP